MSGAIGIWNCNVHSNTFGKITWPLLHNSQTQCNVLFTDNNRFSVKLSTCVYVLSVVWRQRQIISVSMCCIQKYNFHVFVFMRLCKTKRCWLFSLSYEVESKPSWLTRAAWFWDTKTPWERITWESGAVSNFCNILCLSLILFRYQLLCVAIFQGRNFHICLM